MQKPTTTGRRAYETDRLRLQLEFLAAAAAAGHEGHTRMLVEADGMTLVQVSCSCGAYKSASGAELASWRAWLSHARMIILNPQAAAS